MMPKRSQETPEQQEGSPLTPEIMQRVDAYVQASRTWNSLEKGEQPNILNPKLQKQVVEALQFIKEKIKEGKTSRHYTEQEQQIQFKKVDEFIKTLKGKQ